MGIAVVFLGSAVIAFIATIPFVDEHIVTAVVDVPETPQVLSSASAVKEVEAFEEGPPLVESTTVNVALEESTAITSEKNPETPRITSAVTKTISPIVVVPLAETTVTVTSVPTKTPTPTTVVTPTAKPSPIPTKPIPTAYPYTGSDLDQWFTRFSSEYRVDREVLRKLALCESGFNAAAHSRHGYGGLYQFSEISWKSARTQMGHDNNPDLRYDPQEAIRTAAFKISVNGTGAWPACSKGL
jgi:hypothetical protein